MDDRQVADLVDDQQAWPAEEANAILKPAFSFGTGKRTNEIGERRKIHALSGLHGFDAERCGEMAFACSRWAKEMNGFMTIDEAELRQGEDTIAIERRLEGEVEAGERLDRGKPTTLTIIFGLPRSSMIRFNSRATRRPERDVSATRPRHSLVQSPTTANTRNLRPSVS
ncbi:UNVERIFIED_ORG: hypothetical protein GGI57_006360 [Rhizobium aethiopicum]